MTRITLSSVLNIREWPKALPSIKNLDWRVGVAAGVGLASLVAIYFLTRRDTNKIEKQPIQNATVEQLFTKRQLKDQILKAAAETIVTDIQKKAKELSGPDNRVILRKDAKPIADYLDKGLPSGAEYAALQDEILKQESYVFRVLNALLAKGFCKGFDEGRNDFTVIINC
jgi:hypothetical protein